MSCYLLFSKSLLSLATDGKDGHALKFEKVGPTFSSFNAKLPARLLPDEICLIFWINLGFRNCPPTPLLSHHFAPSEK